MNEHGFANRSSRAPMTRRYFRQRLGNVRSVFDATESRGQHGQERIEELILLPWEDAKQLSTNLLVRSSTGQRVFGRSRFRQHSEEKLRIGRRPRRERRTGGEPNRWRIVFHRRCENLFPLFRSGATAQLAVDPDQICAITILQSAAMNDQVSKIA
jgi:hypothetical protein